MSFKRIMTLTFLLALLAILYSTSVLGAEDDLYINITILQSATAQGTVCLDGSPVAYHLDRGHGSGVSSWIIYLDENKLFFRGARIFKAIMKDLWSKGMNNAENTILCGTSAAGLATILNCDNFKSLLPENVKVKCVADVGFFINGKTISGTSDIQEMYRKIVNLHGSAKNLPSACTSVMEPSLTINEAVADWYFERAGFQYIDMYPCARDCNL
ncbi:hypothetical protein MTR67_036094 [Solanum verrucosum]|uniref:Pectin acetylesterase n=1 Tax=Solanum verrucosum TaxID=315347 RepID=A0AAF0ZMX2_SOLVR|nr:hypothetical protein MTR67_036094 [Solanum verrucosum]